MRGAIGSCVVGFFCVCGMRRKKVQVGVLCGVEATRRSEPDFLIFFFSGQM
jgi:hypothetical protein